MLQAKDYLYVIHVPQEVMSLLMKKSPSVDIFCECKQIVPVSLRRDSKMVDCKFVSESGACILSVLSSDNCIRLVLGSIGIFSQSHPLL